MGQKGCKRKGHPMDAYRSLVNSFGVCCRLPVLLLGAFVFAAMRSVGAAEPLALDESPAGALQWGYRPAEGSTVATTPPGFAWRPQPSVGRWELQCATDPAFQNLVYQATAIELNVHRPPDVLKSGKYFWRYRGLSSDRQKTRWSRARGFEIGPDAAPMPMPPREQLLGRVPASHPRLFIRPEDLPRLRELSRGQLEDEYLAMRAQCERLLRNPPPTSEPPKYPAGVERLSEQWREIWWGNRVYTVNALQAASVLSFTRLLDGNEEYGQLARRILMDCATWDPKGSTGYRYNDEAGMPYAYYFARTYTFLHDLLSESERRICREVLRVRGEAMYRHLYPRHLWKPYSSHSNRAWHFLGEVAIALHGEVAEADDWLWFAMNVFYNVYPVWSDSDGGWHEGTSYWASYIQRFTWWADVMRAAVGVDAYKKPYFAQAGYYAMYSMPPGKVGGGFGDLTAKRKAYQNVPLVSQLAAQAGNGHWQWYVEQMGGPKSAGGYLGFVRGALPQVAAEKPSELPASRLFRGTGLAYLNTSLLDANDDVQVGFKSSPMGTWSHGYEANNSFLLWAYGERLLIRSGYRDIYGSDHHRHWMWSTRSVNNITVDGHGQLKHSAAADGRITAFHTSPQVDVVVGEAGGAYRDGEEQPSRLDRFTRTIIFAKPDLVVVFDRVVARHPATYQYWLHAVAPFSIEDQHDITVAAGDVRCAVDFLSPERLELKQTDQYDPNPRPRITLREWHLTASSERPQRAITFVATYRPWRTKEPKPDRARLERRDGGLVLSADTSKGRLVALLPENGDAQFEAEGLACRGQVVAGLFKDGRQVHVVDLADATLD